MRKKVIYILIIAFLLIDAVIIGLFFNKFYNKPEKAHFHAGIQVYVDGKLQDFSDVKYMHTMPCSVKESKNEHESPEELQMDKAHLHDNIGNVVHTHVKGGKWEDLFKNMKYDISSKGTVKGFVNGKEVDNILGKNIEPYESIIILVGNNKNINAYLEKSINKETIVKAEKMSESCGM